MCEIRCLMRDVGCGTIPHPTRKSEQKLFCYFSFNICRMNQSVTSYTLEMNEPMSTVHLFVLVCYCDPLPPSPPPVIK